MRQHYPEISSKEMGVKLKDFLTALLAPTPIAIWVICSLAVSLAGPFGTFDDLNYVQRLEFWSAIIGVSIVLGGVARILSRSVFRDDQPVKQDVAAILAMTAMFSPVLLVLAVTFVPRYQSVWPDIGRMVVYVFLISTAVFVVRRLLPGIEPVSYRKENTPGEPPRLLRRLPPDFVGPILRMSVRDHYVDVVTPIKTHTIRMRFVDAIDEMAGVVGYCTHRSHWVVASAVQSVEHNGGKLALKLINGDIVPVSRKYRGELEKAGLI